MKELRTNFMYWRFRYITRNRLRIQSWWARRRQPTRQPYRPRASAQFVRHRSGRRSWISLLVMMVLLTALQVWSHHMLINPSLVYLLGTVIVVGTIYWTLRGT